MTKLARLALPSLVAFLAAAAGARAQVVTPQPPPTLITSAPYTITAPGYHQLGADLVYAGNGTTNDASITINAGNVTLDFGGHYISGPSKTIPRRNSTASTPPPAAATKSSTTRSPTRWPPAAPATAPPRSVATWTRRSSATWFPA